MKSQTRNEEIANSVSHGIGVLLAIAAIPILIVGAVKRGTAADIVAASVYGTSMLLMFLSSTLYHALRESLNADTSELPIQINSHGKRRRAILNAL